MAGISFVRNYGRAILRPHVSLSDSQLQTLMTAADSLQPERFSATGRGHAENARLFNDNDVADVAKLALAGRVQQAADSVPLTARRTSPAATGRAIRAQFCGHNADTSGVFISALSRLYLSWLILLFDLARPNGFEPLTPRFVVWCSIQLSYGRLIPLPKPASGPGTS